MSQTLDSTAQVFVEATSELLRLFLELRPGGARPTPPWVPCGDGPTIQHRYIRRMSNLVFDRTTCSNIRKAECMKRAMSSLSSWMHRSTPCCSMSTGLSSRHLHKGHLFFGTSTSSPPGLLLPAVHTACYPAE